jgi:hypothetical protein
MSRQSTILLAVVACLAVAFASIAATEAEAFQPGSGRVGPNAPYHQSGVYYRGQSRHPGGYYYGR